ncbi:MAG TPA: hypothetical protein DCP38_16635 [Acidobacteria bacterium]|nr:hypothetical protein [Acidobacteriota bacterium]
MLGVLLAAVPRAQRADPPNIVLRGLKGTMYEGGIRVAGLIEWPGASPPLWRGWNFSCATGSCRCSTA